MKLTKVSLLSLLFWSIYSGGSALAIYNDLDERNSKMSLDILTGEKSPLEVQPEITVEVLVGKAADLRCRSEAGNGLVKWWQTPFGSFGDRKFGNSDPIGISNGTLMISRATHSHPGLYSCYIMDNNGTTVIPYRMNVVDKNLDKPSHRMAREPKTSMVYNLALGVAPSVLVTFVIAFTIGAFSRPYMIKCLQKTRLTIGHEGLFRNTTNKKSSWSNNSAAPKSSTPTESPTKVFWSKNQHEVHVEEANQTEEAEENRHQQKRRSRVIKVYNYDEEGKRYDHVTEPEQVEHEPGPRQRVMSLTRLNTIMNQVQTPDFSTNRRSTNSSGTRDNPPQT